MAPRRHTDDPEDDGRVIADMSAVERPSLMGHIPTRRREARKSRAPKRPKVELTSKERIWMAIGALRAGLTVGCVYVVFLAVLVFGLLAIWTALAA